MRATSRPYVASWSEAFILTQFMPHGMCFAWQKNLVLLHVFSDATIALAYFSIPLALAVFAVKRRDLPLKPLFALFALFIVACGTTHLFAIWTIWHPDYWQAGAAKAVTALVSLVTAVGLAALVPKALALRSPRELELVNRRLEEVSRETEATAEYFTDGFAVLDERLETLRSSGVARELESEYENAPARVVDSAGCVLPRERWPAALALATGEVQSDIVIGIGSPESRRWIAVTASPVAVRSGSATRNRIVVSMRDVTELRTREERQRGYALALHALHLIASMTNGDLREQIDAALLVGLEPLGLERAYLGAIDVASNEIVLECSVALPGAQTPPIEVGARWPVADTMIGRVIERRDILTVPDLVVHARAGGHTHYAGEGSYIAVPIYVDDVAYGAIGFIGRTPRTTPFTAENIEFVKLAGDLIAAALQRGSQNERLDALAFFDSLTGLPNRVLLYDRLVQTIRASQRRDERFAVLFVDLDGFKAVNDRFGHGEGDAVLKVVAARLKDALRGSDTVARLGGDEFVIIGAGIATLHDAATFSERILTALRQPIRCVERTHHLTASIGVSFYPIDGTEMQTLIERADIALFHAKQSGRNTVHFSDREALTGV